MREETVERMMIEVLKREKEKLDTLEPGTDEYKRVSTEYNEHCTRMRGWCWDHIAAGVLRGLA